MAFTFGIICALIAMACWGVGDYLIQKNSRSLGSWKTLFFISFFGAIVLLPFVWSQIIQLFVHPDVHLLFLVVASLVLLAAALLEIKSLKDGKLVVVEPLYALEIPVSAALAFFFLSEAITITQTILVALLIVGLILVSIKRNHLEAKLWLEKGVMIAVISTFFMGATNFLFGVGARETSALMINWFTNAFMAIACLIYIIRAGKFNTLLKDIQEHKQPLFWMSLLDTAAWIAFAYAMLLAPISISVALSQSYIIITVLFGMFLNKEHIQTHQKVGLALAIVMAILLSLSL